jgi:hypothetical protein
VNIAVVVNWDGQRPEWLLAALQSLDLQIPAPSERCLVVDSPDARAAISALGVDLSSNGWIVRDGYWQDSAAARNLGMTATQSPWLVFWDARNVMPAGFLAAVTQAIRHAAPEVGILYSDINYVDEELNHGRWWRVPDWNYWTLREGNYIDGASAWRREALDLAGGWSSGNRLGDYASALEVTRRGWLAQRRPGPPIVIRQHASGSSEMRAYGGNRLPGSWQTCSLAIVSLLAGRDNTYPRWERFLYTAELPPHTALYVVDNSGDPEFSLRVSRTCQELAARRQLDHISISVRPDRYAERGDAPRFERERHFHIARMYADLLPRVGEDLIFTLEDDIEPPPDAIRRLAAQIGRHPWGNYAVIAGAYDMGGDVLCARRLDHGRDSPIYWHQMSDEPIDAVWVGGGCTLWANWALKGLPIPFLWHGSVGWDPSLCGTVLRRGYGIRVHGGVRCTHHVHGVIRTL